MQVTQFTARVREAADTLLLQPDSGFQFFVTAIAAIFVLLVLFIKVGEKLEVSNSDGLSGVVATFLGIVATLSGYALWEIYIAPQLKLPVLALLVAGVVVACIVLTIPVIKFWTRSAYFRTLFAWAISLAAAIGTAALIDAGFGAVRGGSDSFRSGAQHNRATQEVIDAK